MGLTLSLLVAALYASLLQAEPAEPEILRLLKRGDEARSVEQIRLRPDETRDALALLLRLGVREPRPGDRVRSLLQAERLARLYARAWSDSFFIYRVEQFKRWSAGERVELLEADSLRLAGIEAFYREGPEAAIRLWEGSLSHYRALGDLAGQAAVLGNLGSGYYAMGQLDRALRYHTRSLELAEAAGDHRTKGNALGNIASVHKDRGDLALAAEFYGRALEIRPLSGDRRGEAADLNNLGLVRDALGDLDGAEAQFRRALELNRSDDRDRAAATNVSNLANLATKRGRYDEALKLYDEALELRRRTGDRRGEAHDLHNLGLLHLRWGDYPAARRSLKEALAVLIDVGPPINRARVRADLAAAEAAMGHLQSALDELDRAELEAAGEERLGPELALRRADVMVELNDFEAAAQLYRKAKAGYERLEDHAGEAEAESGLGFLYLTRQDYAAAEETLTRALLIQERLGDPRPAALTRMLLGDVQVLHGDTALARQTYERALAAQRSLGDAVAEGATLGALADLDRAQGALKAAESGYRAGLARLNESPAPPIEWSLRLGLGLSLRARGALDDAALELRRAIAQVETVGGTLPVEEHRYGYLEDKWSVYAELVKTELARGRVGAAFEASEAMRSRQLLDVLARGRIASGRAPHPLIREEETLRRRIGELTRALYASGGGVRNLRGPTPTNARAEAVRQSLAAAQVEYEGLLLALKRAQPEYAALVLGSTATVTDLQDLLPAGAAFIEYLVANEWSVAFVVSSEGVVAVELPVDRKTLRQLVEFFRGVIGRPSSVGPGDELWRAPLRRLHELLLKPVEERGLLEGRRLLVIAPHAELHYLPFQALLRREAVGERFLVESYEVAYVPSGSVWAYLARREQARSARGVLAMAPRPEALANSAEEVRTIARSAPAARLLIGPQATETRLLELAPRHRILHLATYGVLNTVNPLFSFVELNPGKDSDGRLEVHEVFQLNLAADLVVLSACQTALGSGLHSDVPPGDEWVGLVRAFLYAGARSVLASLWPVDDRATGRLMQKFYAGLQQGRSKAAALADAQRALIRERSSADPFYWAAFVLTGRAE